MVDPEVLFFDGTHRAHPSSVAFLPKGELHLHGENPEDDGATRKILQPCGTLHGALPSLGPPILAVTCHISVFHSLIFIPRNTIWHGLGENWKGNFHKAFIVQSSQAIHFMHECML